MSNPLVATTSDIPSTSAAHRDGWTGLPLADDYMGIKDAIDSGSWIDGSIAGLGAALDGRPSPSTRSARSCRWASSGPSSRSSH
ncbi:hypothetical protein NKG94_22705 [Micromonospora sp. M12]